MAACTCKRIHGWVANHATAMVMTTLSVLEPSGTGTGFVRQQTFLLSRTPMISVFALSGYLALSHAICLESSERISVHTLRESWAQTVLGIILGGGAGSRLYPLTKTRAKPAVPLGANYRLIDIPVSNCINSGVNKIYCMTQFNSASLNRHLASAYVSIYHGLTFSGAAPVKAESTVAIRVLYGLPNAAFLSRSDSRLSFNFERDHLGTRMCGRICCRFGDVRKAIGIPIGSGYGCCAECQRGQLQQRGVRGGACCDTEPQEHCLVPRHRRCRSAIPLALREYHPHRRAGLHHIVRRAAACAIPRGFQLLLLLLSVWRRPLMSIRSH